MVPEWEALQLEFDARILEVSVSRVFAWLSVY